MLGFGRGLDGDVWPGMTMGRLVTTASAPPLVCVRISKAYALPGVSPVMRQEVFFVRQDRPSGRDIASYRSASLIFAGGFHVICTAPVTGLTRNARTAGGALTRPMASALTTVTVPLRQLGT